MMRIHGLKSRDYELGTNIKRLRAGDQVMGTRRQRLKAGNQEKKIESFKQGTCVLDV